MIIYRYNTAKLLLYPYIHKRGNDIFRAPGQAGNFDRASTGNCILPKFILNTGCFFIYPPLCSLSLFIFFLIFFIFSSSMSHMSSLSLRIHHVLTCGCWRGLSTMGKPSPPGSILHVSSYVNALKTFSCKLVHFLCCESNIESSWMWSQLESITQLSFKSRKRAGLQNAF